MRVVELVVELATAECASILTVGLHRGVPGHEGHREAWRLLRLICHFWARLQSIYQHVSEVGRRRRVLSLLIAASSEPKVVS